MSVPDPFTSFIPKTISMIHPDLFTLLGQLDVVLHTGKKYPDETSPEIIKTLSSLHGVISQAVTGLAAAQFEFQTAIEKGAVQLQKVRRDPRHRKPNDSNFNRLLGEFLVLYSQIVEPGAITALREDPSGSRSGTGTGSGTPEQ